MLILCITIFIVRIIDVSLGTFRMILVIKGKKLVSSIVGFIEIAIWFAIVREALNTDIESWWVVMAYAGGFAAGTYIGAIISERFIKGTLGLQVITEKKEKLLSLMKEHGYGVSFINVRGHNEEINKHMFFIEIEKHRLNHLQNLIKSIDEKAFIVVNETKSVQNGYFYQSDDK